MTCNSTPSPNKLTFSDRETNGNDKNRAEQNQSPLTHRDRNCGLGKDEEKNTAKIHTISNSSTPSLVPLDDVLNA